MTGRRDTHGKVRARLREAAGAHEPDRARILARIERGMADTETSRRPAQRPQVLGWARVVGATAAVAGVLAVGGYAAASALKEEDKTQQTVAVTPTPEPSAEESSRGEISPDATSSPRPEQPTAAESPPVKPPEPPPAVTPPPDVGTEEGPLWSDGSVDPHSNDFWAQSNVTVRSEEQLTSLTVQLRIKQTGGVNSTGAWRSLPEGDFELTVGERDGFLVYTWALKEGRTVPAGEFVFAGQYDHDRGGRDAGDDRYAATATADGEQVGVQGDFASQDSDDEDS
ncbi:hypothetical protein [Streptomyces flaveus]|uniref:Uncharacterized protein n=1 Tax=Streptomyces flaveus TaxID=66370 RepID=A0A917VJB7_9ACTN|nr:hypothetical protein [Streptomyces flaveus]GGK86374.1 hypothetical protein GCM10010094_54480 [Streptomyces flaveus]